MKKLRMRIAKDGKVRMDVEGAVGTECREFSALFEAAVGNVVQRELKPEHDQIKEQACERVQDSAS